MRAKPVVAAVVVLSVFSVVATFLGSPILLTTAWLSACGTLIALTFFSVVMDLKRVDSDTVTSMDYVPQLAAIVLMGPAGAVLVAAVSEIPSVVLLDRRKSRIKKIFNASQLVLGVAVAAWVFLIFGGRPVLEAGSSFEYWQWFKTTLPPFLVAATSYFAFNTLVVSTVIAISEQRPFGQALRRLSAGLLVFDVSMSLLSLLVAFLFLRFGPFALLVSIIPLIGLRYSYGVNYELRRLNADLLRLMVKTIEAQDPYTSGHSVRVAETARKIARSLGLRSGEVERIETAALLHDVGKIDIAYSEILRQEGPLTEEQKELIRAHPDRGVDILRSVRSIGTEILEAVRHHHERFDGDGYPSGLKGLDIPLGARIIMICDTIDAMTTARPYRGALPIHVVREELGKHAGSQFDARLVDTVLDSNILETLDYLDDHKPLPGEATRLVQPVLKAGAG